MEKISRYFLIMHSKVLGNFFDATRTGHKQDTELDKALACSDKIIIVFLCMFKYKYHIYLNPRLLLISGTQPSNQMLYAENFKFVILNLSPKHCSGGRKGVGGGEGRDRRPS